MPLEGSTFDFHGVQVVVRFDDDEVRDRVEKDFSFFLRPESPPAGIEDFGITARLREPDRSQMPHCRASVYTPRNICYADGPRTWLDYFGRALAVYDRDTRTVDVSTTDVHLLTEIVYLTILSRVSELLEEHGLHRVHSLAVEHEGEAALFLMPSGCGKSTLALGLLQRESPLRILSEDSPLVDGDGNVYPFPLRIGVLGDIPAGIAPEHVTEQRRMEFAPKRLISLSAFPGRFCEEPARARFVFFGHRHTDPGCRLMPAGFQTTWKELGRHMIIGVGLYQGVEFLLQSSLRDLIAMRQRMASRIRAARALARNAEVYELELGPNPSDNAEWVFGELSARGFGEPIATPETQQLATG